MTEKEIISALECCIKAKTNADCEALKCPFYDNEIDICMYVNNEEVLYANALDLINRQQAEIERLTTIAKKMHSWIFTNSYDEEKAYAECGLTDEENTLLGYCGKIVFESKEMVGEQG